MVVLVSGRCLGWCCLLLDLEYISDACLKVSRDRLFVVIVVYVLRVVGMCCVLRMVGVWRDKVWYGIEYVFGYGMVWYGMVWYGMVWYGMVHVFEHISSKEHF